jgi:hypothetical protein
MALKLISVFILRLVQYFIGLLVLMLATGPKVRGFKYGRRRWIKIDSTTSFGEEVKPSVRCHKIYDMLKTPADMTEILRQLNSEVISSHLPVSLLDVSATTREF